MNSDELIKRLKKLLNIIPDEGFNCSNDFKYVRMLVSMYERDNNDYSVERCFDDFIMWDAVEYNLKKFIDDRDARGLLLYAAGYNFDDDVFHIDTYGHIENITLEIMNTLIKDILHYLGDEDGETDI